MFTHHHARDQPTVGINEIYITMPSDEPYKTSASISNYIRKYGVYEIYFVQAIDKNGFYNSSILPTTLSHE